MKIDDSLFLWHWQKFTILHIRRAGKKMEYLGKIVDHKNILY
jgi:hypothetical protein